MPLLAASNCANLQILLPLILGSMLLVRIFLHQWIQGVSAFLVRNINDDADVMSNTFYVRNQTRSCLIQIKIQYVLHNREPTYSFIFVKIRKLFQQTNLFSPL